MSNGNDDNDDDGGSGRSGPAYLDPNFLNKINRRKINMKKKSGGGSGGGGGDGNGGNGGGGGGNGGDGNGGGGNGDDDENDEEIPFEQFQTLPGIDPLPLSEDALKVLQNDLATTDIKRQSLESQVEQLQKTNEELRKRLDQMSRERFQLSPDRVLADLGRTLEDVEEDLADSVYDIADFELELKANVVSDGEKLQFHLPGADEEYASENLSTINLHVKRESKENPLDNPEVPDLREMRIGDAKRKVRKAGFTVGLGADRDSGVVVDQYPSPFSAAPSGTTVDLTVSEEGASSDGA